MKTFLAVMVLALMVAVPAAASHTFDDVPTSHTHHDSIDWLASTGITTGCDADSFCPADKVSRAQMATFLHRFDGLQQDGGGFTPQVRIVRSAVRADCPTGTVLVGGGVGQSSGQAVTHSYPSQDGQSWFAGPGAAYALCMEQ